ncbi:hypothetical protein [Endozoicomonas numazuensis]|uniref:Uncharacterized protein n=1 Tax=Endozoicomonas numazuensis TaxID=1137799 RepID=A0A081NFH8_9GAMM|nr:hypothetical protein [Endozoicomonas numazuensis]KEQ17201.1 hypothetical protein GZ78_15285 [Endozoicomonas numazuensis]
MIVYKFDEEVVYAEYYAKKMEDKRTAEILKRGSVSNTDEARHLSLFFWKMVDASIDDEKKDIQFPWEEGAEFWNEKLMNSFSGYLENSGYENEWEEIVDQQ